MPCPPIPNTPNTPSLRSLRGFHPPLPSRPLRLLRLFRLLLVLWLLLHPLASSWLLLHPLASSKSSPSPPLAPDTTLYIIYKPTTMKVISTDKAPAAIGPYSQAIEANGMVFCSGQIPIDPATGVFVEGGIQEQTRQVLTNASQVLAAAGTDLSHVVKTTVFLSDMANFVAMNEVYAQFFSQPFPARSAVAVKDLPKGALVEIEVLAVK